MPDPDIQALITTAAQAEAAHNAAIEAEAQATNTRVLATAARDQAREALNTGIDQAITTEAETQA
jgi:hypothetical protein